MAFDPVRAGWRVSALLLAPVLAGIAVGCMAGVLGYHSAPVVGGLAGGLAALVWLVVISRRVPRRSR